jgi:hypothetical protein
MYPWTKCLNCRTDLLSGNGFQCREKLLSNWDWCLKVKKRVKIEGTEGTEGTKGTKGTEGTEGTICTKGIECTEGTEGTEGHEGTS